MVNNSSKDNKKDDNLLALRTLETILAAQNLSKKQIYLQNFVRGMFFSLGSVIGLTVLATIVLWILSLFDSFPFIQNISESIKSSL